MYEQLKAVPDRTPLQDRLMLLVHLRKQQIRVREMELVTTGLMTKENVKHLDDLLDGYKSLMFPGVEKVETKVDADMRRAKEALAHEVDKVFLVRPLAPGEAPPSGKVHPELAQVQARQLMEDAKRKADEDRRMRQRRRKPPAAGG